MPRRARASNTVTPLSRFLVGTRKANNLTIRQMAQIAGTSSSVCGAWEKGASPGLESIPALKRLCDHFKVSLSFALTGEPDTQSTPGVEALFDQTEFFDGYARITVHRLIPKNGLKKGDSS